MERSNPILEMTFNFSLMIIAYCELLEDKKRFVIANQLLKSGTSIGANVREAQNSESRLDFTHKLKIAAKEAEETEYWLLLCEHSHNYPKTTELIPKIEEIKRVLNSIIITMKKKQ